MEEFAGKDSVVVRPGYLHGRDEQSHGGMSLSSSRNVRA